MRCSRGATTPNKKGVSDGGIPTVTTKPSQTDPYKYKGVNPLLAGIPGALGALGAGALVGKVDYGRADIPENENQAFTVDPNLLDPTRALQNVGTAFSGTNQMLSSNTSGGNFLTNRIVSAAAEAGNRADVATTYEEKNKDILNRTDMFNAQQRTQAQAQNNDLIALNAKIKMQEEQDKLGFRQEAIGLGSNAINAMLQQYGRNKENELALAMSGTTNYQYQGPNAVGGPFGFRGNTLRTDGIQIQDPSNVSRSAITTAFTKKK